MTQANQFTVGQKIALMRKGKLLKIGEVTHLYRTGSVRVSCSNYIFGADGYELRTLTDKDGYQVVAYTPEVDLAWKARQIAKTLFVVDWDTFSYDTLVAIEALVESEMVNRDQN